MNTIPLFKVFMADDLNPVVDVLRSGYIGQGPKVDEFEDLLIEYLDNPYVSTVNSGTSALHLALRLIKDHCDRSYHRHVHDEVLTTPLTCTATNFPILANDLKLKWVDLDPKTCNVDLTDLRRKISERTLAIMVVHWGGYPVDLVELADIQQQCLRLYGWAPPIIEDCAHALGAKFSGERLGSKRLPSNFRMFSFQAIKHLTTGDGGCLVSPDSLVKKQADLLRWYGLDRKSSADFRCAQNIQSWGYKFHMNDIAAAIGIQNFQYLEQILSVHVRNGKFYDRELANIPGVTTLEMDPNRESSYWIYTIRVENRPNFIQAMKDRGIGVSQVHDRNDKHDCLKDYRIPLPNTDVVCGDMICIPCGWWVSADDAAYIVDSIRKGW